jgi:hypothetical protein
MQDQQWHTLAPATVPDTPTFEAVVQNVKSVIEAQYPGSAFQDDTHKSHYQVINCKLFAPRFEATMLEDTIRSMFDITCRVAIRRVSTDNNSSMLIEVMVPRDVNYSFTEKYTCRQITTCAVGLLITIVGLYTIWFVM